MITLLNGLCCDSHNYIHFQYFTNIPIFDVVMPYKSLCLFLLRFCTKPEIQFYCSVNSFSEPPSTRNIRSKSVYVLVIYVETPELPSMYKGKGYCEFLLSLSISCVHLFIHTKNVIVVLRLVLNLSANNKRLPKVLTMYQNLK